jgi:hypothetical protein
MLVFRRSILALAGVTLFAGLASAQNNPTCTVNNTVPPIVRAEGLTELSGDVVVICTGGTPLATGAQIPQGTFQIFMNGPVTSRLIGGGQASEVLLMIDEPGANLAGLGGSTLPQVLCPTPLSGCIETVGPNNGLPTYIATTGANPTQGPNVFQGLVSGNSITFPGIPVQPPVSSGTNRVFRITNIRANANAISNGSSSIVPMTAQVTLTGVPLNLNNANLSTVTTAFIQNGLVSSLRNAGNTAAGSVIQLAQCARQTNAFGTLLQFQENFTTAFKTRYTGGAVSAPPQNTPGVVYNSESNFIFNAVNSGNGVFSVVAGQADYGTRLKATFSNIPAGASIFVSTSNIASSTNAVVPANLTAVLVGSETQADGSGGPPVVPQTGTIGTVGVATVALTPSTVTGQTGNTGTAVWEVTAANLQTIDTLNFGVWISFTPNLTATPATPATGDLKVSLSFAPTNLGSSEGAASSSLPIPRFAPGPAASAFATILQCQTALLFPFVTNTGGFDTGIAIANTSLDGTTFNTAPQNGGCALNWFSGGSATPAATPACSGTTTTGCFPAVAAGSVSTGLASSLVPGFQGYMIAVCNFQLAHGFAFVSDLGARNLAMGYLALVLPNPPAPGGATTRTALPESLGN